MYSTQNRHCIPLLHCHSNTLQEELVGLRLSSLSPDELTLQIITIFSVFICQTGFAVLCYIIYTNCTKNVL